MKYTNIFLVLLTLPNLCLADGVVTATPLRGQCVADVMSKTYVTNPNVNPVQYSCSYDCLAQDGIKARVKATHIYRVTGNPADDMGGMVCASVRIEIVQKESYSDATVYADAFWAPLSLSPEIRQWANGHGVKLPAEIVAQVKKDFESQINEILTSYLAVDADKYPNFKIIANKLQALLWPSKEAQAELKDQLIKAQNSDPTKVNMNDPDSMVQMILKSSGQKMSYLLQSESP